MFPIKLVKNMSHDDHSNPLFLSFTALKLLDLTQTICRKQKIFFKMVFVIKKTTARKCWNCSISHCAAILWDGGDESSEKLLNKVKFGPLLVLVLCL